MLLPKVSVAEDSNITALPGIQAWPPVLFQRGPGTKSSLHAHHFLHLMIAMEGQLKVSFAADDMPTECRAVLTDSNCPHAIDAENCEIALLFIDPQSRIGATLSRVLQAEKDLKEAHRFFWGDGAAVLSDCLLGPSQSMNSTIESLLETLLEQLGCASPRLQSMHPGVKRVLRSLHEESPHQELSAQRLADLAGLSESRLLHIFSESLGIPLRRYRLWLKFSRATIGLVEGKSFAAAAQEAGFSDAAHMTRTFRKMFGVTPSQLS